MIYSFFMFMFCVDCIFLLETKSIVYIRRVSEFLGIYCFFAYPPPAPKVDRGGVVFYR